ncbi:hypothetical protein FOVSG1_004168 [Fusarium oxysporum f. sp. vasinfectum]
MTKIHYLDEDDMACSVSIKGLPSTSYETPFPTFYIHKRREHGLNIYISKQSAEVATSVELHRSLGAWLMGDPSYLDAKETDPRLSYLVGTILKVKSHRLFAVKDILGGEGIVDVDELQCSIYHPQSQKQKSPYLFSAQPTSLVSSRSTLDSNRTSTPAQVDDLSERVWSLSFKENKDSSATEYSRWVKYF